MGKAAKLKQLRRLASQLPPVQIKKVVTDKIPGNEVSKTVKEDQSGNAIDPKRMYSRKQIVEVEINHYKKMKQNFYKAGMAGAAVYSKSVKEYVKQNNKTIQQ